MKLYSVQALRAIAALAVVFGHSMAASVAFGLERPVLPTGAGVDLFFAISGFIMVYASDPLFGFETGPRVFIRRRLIRILPMYWAATTVMVALLLLSGSQGKSVPGLGAIVSSYLFVPNSSFGMVNGMAYPILSLGWTLNYEMLFYCIFAGFLFMRREAAVLSAVAVLTVVVALGILAHPQSVFFQFWSQPIILEFALGLLIGLAFRRGWKLPDAARVTLAVAAVVLLAADLGAITPMKTTPNDFHRLVSWGVPAALILAAAVLGPDMLPKKLESGAVLLGDASYSLYLTHPFLLIILAKVWSSAKIGQPWLFVTVAIVAAVTLALVLSRLEGPLQAALQGRAKRAPAAA